MNFRDSPNEAAFRQQVRRFIARELPADLRSWQGDWGITAGGAWHQKGGAIRAWARKLRARGWMAPAWPQEYGGGGLSVMEQFILNEEMAMARAPRPGGIGIGWVGPTIIIYGTEEQKRQHLPPILDGEVVWCQGFSEPNAGSDLASVQTRATRDGDDYVINGEKIWCGGAHRSDWMILLARTDPSAPKHKGISYFLVDMKTPGISVQPIVTMAATHEFCQVIFQDVRVPASCLLGEENRGWYMAVTTLEFERSNISSAVGLILIVRDLVAYARENRGLLQGNPTLAYELADRAIEAETARLLSYRVVSLQVRRQPVNYEASIAKLYTSELDQRVAATGMKLLGLYGQLERGSLRAPLRARLERLYLYSVASTIGGGTSEIQRNIIATRGLGLPRE